ncbi:MAG: peptidase MA family metallohydrolase, partial [Desulfatiglandaceae bacterium]
LSANLEHTFGWNFNLKPSILLIKDGEAFRQMAESPLTVAFAVPARNLIVIDHSRMHLNPFTLEVILKHELCHLLLHHHVREVALPRWLDEGVCQWASDGIADIILSQKQSSLNRATLQRSLIPLNALENDFPRDDASLVLAYEQSKSVVTYIVHKFGKEGVLSVLNGMRQGEPLDTAILNELSISLAELEEKWRHTLRQRVTWFTYVIYNIYEILFVLGALITVFAFIKVFIRKKAYMKDESENDPFS